MRQNDSAERGKTRPERARTFCTSLISAEEAELDQKAPQSQPVAGVHPEQGDGSASRRSAADDVCSDVREVFFPVISTRMKKWRDLPPEGVNSSQIRALVEVALRTGEREIGEVIRAAVLSGDDVLHMKAKPGELLGDVAVFAAIRRALSHAQAGRRIHSSGLGVSEDGPRFRFE